MSNYIITNDTLLITSIEELTTKIIEKDKEIIINQAISNVINESCLKFGSSLQGRIDGTKYLLNYSYKLPIVIDNTSNLILFPTSSYSSDKCCWICYNNIIHYSKYDKHNTLINFNNDTPYVIPISYSSFENQYFRAMRLYNILFK